MVPSFYDHSSKNWHLQFLESWLTSLVFGGQVASNNLQLMKENCCQTHAVTANRSPLFSGSLYILEQEV